MLNLYAAQINSLFVHKIGNKSRNEGSFLANEPTEMNDELHALLKEYFLKPFREKENNFLKFHHEVDLDYNTVYDEVLNSFDIDGYFKNASREIAKHLHEQSKHPHIKAGELYVAYFNDILIDDNRVDAIGIFKSEIKQDFLQFAKDDNHLDLVLTQGVNLAKLDKGALIINTEEDEGYKILSVDQNRYDTKYWLDDFLGVIEFEDDNYYTKRYLKLAQDFAKDVVLPAEDKKASVMFMNEAYNHFGKNDAFKEDTFLNEVCHNPELIPEFKNYKQEKGPKYLIEDLSDFNINNTAVKESRKKFKSIIELDTNITIKMDFVNTQSADQFIEKGWDEERQQYYYLCYFNKEKN